MFYHVWQRHLLQYHAIFVKKKPLALPKLYKNYYHILFTILEDSIDEFN